LLMTHHSIRLFWGGGENEAGRFFSNSWCANIWWMCGTLAGF
jgi:hypothetical protein